MKTTYCSAVPEKTETRVVVVDPGRPAKIILEVSQEEMRMLRYFAAVRRAELGPSTGAGGAAHRFLSKTVGLGGDDGWNDGWNPDKCFID